jgi:hypothetical protein
MPFCNDGKYATKVRSRIIEIINHLLKLWFKGGFPGFNGFSARVLWVLFASKEVFFEFCFLSSEAILNKVYGII